MSGPAGGIRVPPRASLGGRVVHRLHTCTYIFPSPNARTWPSQMQTASGGGAGGRGERGRSWDHHGGVSALTAWGPTGRWPRAEQGGGGPQTRAFRGLLLSQSPLLHEGARAKPLPPPQVPSTRPRARSLEISSKPTAGRRIYQRRLQDAITAGTATNKQAVCGRCPGHRCGKNHAHLHTHATQETGKSEWARGSHRGQLAGLETIRDEAGRGLHRT